MLATSPYYRFAVRVAADVPGALSEIDQRKFDVLVSDLNISGLLTVRSFDDHISFHTRDTANGG
jgi:hypothetical protein